MTTLRLAERHTNNRSFPIIKNFVFGGIWKQNENAYKTQATWGLDVTTWTKPKQIRPFTAFQCWKPTWVTQVAHCFPKLSPLNWKQYCLFWNVWAHTKLFPFNPGIIQHLALISRVICVYAYSGCRCFHTPRDLLICLNSLPSNPWNIPLLFHNIKRDENMFVYGKLTGWH